MSGVSTRDPGLQPERTAQAWERTGLTLLGCSLVLVAIDKQTLHLGWLVPSLAVLGVAVVVILTAERRYRAARQAIDGSPEALHDGRLVAVTAGAGFVLGLVALATWVASQ